MFKIKIGLGDFVPGAHSEKSFQADQEQTNQFKLVVSFLYLLSKKSRDYILL